MHTDPGPARSSGDPFPARATPFAAGTRPAREVLAETQSAILPHVTYLGTLGRVFIAVALGGIAVTVLLFLLALRRSGERMERLAERLEMTKEANDGQGRIPDAAARRPRNHDDLAERLRDRRF